MEYGKIIAVTGLPGLFELLSSKTDGAIVRSLEDQTTKFVSSRVHNFSHLESIEVFTVRDNVNLAEVFQSMEKSEEKLPDGKDNKVLKSYFEKVYGDLDFSRVYNSDLKKMVKWYQVLKENNIEIKVRDYQEEEAAIEDAAPVEEQAISAEEEKTKTKKAAPKKKAATEEKEEKPVKAEKSAKESKGDSEEKPAKKTAKKKKTEE